MKLFIKRIILAGLALDMVCFPALAQTVALEGTVTAARTQEVYAASTGVVDTLHVIAGQAVAVGDAIANLRTTPVYAEEDGTVSAVFGEPGDLTDTVAERCGAVIYLESTVTYTVSASTQNAYDSVDTRTVYVGETVYIRNRANTERTGTGVITTVDGDSYTVRITDGKFKTGESLSLYRDAAYSDTQRIGRGDVARNAPVAVTGTGRIVSVAVDAGQAVKRGDLLMETLEGSGTTAAISTDTAGVVAQVNAEQGATVEENSVVAVIWPWDAMQIEAPVYESDLAAFSIGDQVELVFSWNADSGKTTTGTVTAISSLSDSQSEDTRFTVCIGFEPEESVRYGMNVTINTLESIP